MLENEAIPGTSRHSDEYEDEVMETQKNEATQTDLTVDNVTKIMEEFSLLNHRVYTLEQKLKNLEINEETFKNDDNKTLYYTGLPKADMLFILFEKNEDCLPVHPNKVLSPFQQFVLTLMKLRLNLPFKYLAYRFNIAPSTCSRFFYDCIDILFERLKGFVYWPSRESLKKICRNVLRSHLETK